MTKKNKKPRGKYAKWLLPNNLILLLGWARDGATNEQLAEFMGINPKTLYDWMAKYPEIAEAISQGKEIIDRKVENALLKRALGYEYVESEYEVVELDEVVYEDRLHRYMIQFKDSHPEATDTELKNVRDSFPRSVKMLTKQKTKEIVPDTTAQIFWLKNRKSDVWRDKQDINHSGQIGGDDKLGAILEQLMDDGDG